MASPANFKDLTDCVFDRLTVVKRDYSKNKKWQTYWLCLCSCKEQNFVVVKSSKLINGETKSCGCLRKEATSKRSTVHGFNKRGDRHKLYDVFFSMKSRCYKVDHKQYPDYGARGITIYQQWLDNPKSFFDWCIKNGWEEGLFIDRIDNNSPYSPDNCRFATRIEQNRNKRSNKLVTYNGETAPLSQICEKYGLEATKRFYKMVWHRLKKGWQLEQALKTPLQS